MTTKAIPAPSLLQRLYQWTLDRASSPHATWIVTLVSFTESSFFPLPPDLMLIPMILANKARAWRLALLCSVASVLGGILGYAIGYFLFETLGEFIINTYNLASAFERFQTDFQAWGFWIIALKGLTPIPFKLVTIASGVAKLNFQEFILASIIARFFRFYLLSALLWYFGDWAKVLIERYVGWVLAAILGALVAGFLIVKWVT